MAVARTPDKPRTSVAVASGSLLGRGMLDPGMDTLTLVLTVLLVGSVAISLLLGRALVLAMARRSEAEGRALMAEQARALLERDAAAARAERDEARGRLEEAGQRLSALTAREAELNERLESQRREHERDVATMRQAQQQVEENLRRYQVELREQFAALASTALGESARQFLALAEQKFAAAAAQGRADLDQRRAAFEQLLEPIRQALSRADAKLGELEQQRVAQFSALGEQVRAMNEGQNALRAETRRLVTALREPHVRGRYGEIQLRRVAELAGMSAHCDFCEQASQRDDEGRALRPDMVVQLPNGRVLAVDAKTNIQAYLDALEAPDPDSAEAHLERFARHVADQAARLGSKGYWRNYEGSPEFVVMFIPGDQFLDAALARRPALLEEAAARGVVLATPSTLIAMLRAVHVGFAEKRLSEEAREIRALATQLHERAGVMLEHLGGLGNALQRAVERYNTLAGSVESRFMPTLRRIEEAGVTSGRELTEPAPLAAAPRLLDTPPS